MPNSVFTRLAAFLNATGWNYTVFLSEFSTPARADESSEHAVQRAVSPHAVASEFQPVSSAEMFAEIDASLRHAGDSGAGPDPNAIVSAEFESLLAELLAHIQRVAMAATALHRFRFREGHPAYPVFWDFAFLLVGPQTITVLVGSSSD